VLLAVYENTRPSPDRLLPFSHSHLLFSVTLGPLPMEGLGVDGLSNQFPLEAPNPNGLGEPYDGRLLPTNPPPIALLNRGLAFGEKGNSLDPPWEGLPFPDNGEGEYALLGDPLCGVAVRGYRGGVIY
jgi:hypothetical protein